LELEFTVRNRASQRLLRPSAIWGAVPIPTDREFKWTQRGKLSNKLLAPAEKRAMTKTILIVDDHEIVRQAIRTILANLRPEWVICRESTNGQEAIEAVKELNPDLVILDISMPFMSGLEAARRISKMKLGCRILIFTIYESVGLMAEVRTVGAHGFVVKSQAARHLVQALDTLLAGGTFFNPTTQSISAEDSGQNQTAPINNIFSPI
jgi:DNA-binding NarL/FixJ family response regulator